MFKAPLVRLVFPVHKARSVPLVMLVLLDPRVFVVLRVQWVSSVQKESLVATALKALVVLLVPLVLLVNPDLKVPLECEVNKGNLVIKVLRAKWVIKVERDLLDPLVQRVLLVSGDPRVNLDPVVYMDLKVPEVSMDPPVLKVNLVSVVNKVSWVQ